MFVCVFAKKFPALASQSCCQVSRPRAVGEYEYRLLSSSLSVIFKISGLTWGMVLLSPMIWIKSLRSSAHSDQTRADHDVYIHVFAVFEMSSSFQVLHRQLKQSFYSHLKFSVDLSVLPMLKLGIILLAKNHFVPEKALRRSPWTPW